MVAGFAVLAQLTGGIAWIAIASVLPLVIEDYSINRTTASLLLTLPLLMGAVIGVPSGVIIGRMGIRRAYTLAWLLMTLQVLSPLAPNFTTLLALRLGAGTGFVLATTATGPLIMQWFRLRDTLVMNGIVMASLFLGSAIALFITAPLADVLGWRGALGVFGAISVLGAVAWIPLGRPVGEVTPLVPVFSVRALWTVLSNRTVVILLTAEIGALTQYGALTSWLPSFLNEVRGLSLTQAGLATGLLPFIGTFVVLLAGFAAYRVGPTRNFIIVGGLLAGLGGPGAFLFDNLGGIYISLIVLGLGSHLYIPVYYSLPMGLPGMTPEKLAVVWGTIFSLQSFALFLGPLLVGAFRDAYGSFIPGFVVAAVAAWSLFIGGMLLPRGTPSQASG